MDTAVRIGRFGRLGHAAAYYWLREQMRHELFYRPSDNYLLAYLFGHGWLKIPLEITHAGIFSALLLFFKTRAVAAALTCRRSDYNFTI